MKKLLLILTIALVLVAALSGCATKRVMKNCEQVNDTEYFFCEEQYKVFR